ncbi:CLUMA_CG005733, isoform A [Clunio marinus]|uniref:CLUMA_CG005733, isoform A n=1 Tax=Clunio marinus TaxID=568069 RepID=A0A1J1HVU0_9DIPT|nr:CLUMA_CG005733, isoform A [Clunio marinus]
MFVEGDSDFNIGYRNLSKRSRLKHMYT